MKQSVADLHITQHDNQQDDAGTITGDNMIMLSKHQSSRQNFEHKFSLVPPRELYAQVVIATNANQPEPGNWHTARQLSSNTPSIHHLKAIKLSIIRVVIAKLANHPNCKTPYALIYCAITLKRKLDDAFFHCPHGIFFKRRKNSHKLPKYTRIWTTFPKLSRIFPCPVFSPIYTHMDKKQANYIISKIKQNFHPILSSTCLRSSRFWRRCCCRR